MERGYPSAGKWPPWPGKFHGRFASLNNEALRNTLDAATALFQSLALKDKFVVFRFEPGELDLPVNRLR
jgi:hypothetical protein